MSQLCLSKRIHFPSCMMSLESSTFCLYWFGDSKRHWLRLPAPRPANRHRDSLPRQNSAASASTSRSSSSPLRSSAVDTPGRQLSSSVRPPPPVKSIRTKYIYSWTLFKTSAANEEKKKNIRQNYLGSCASSGTNWHYFFIAEIPFKVKNLLLKLGKPNDFTVLQVYTFIHVFMGNMLSFHQFGNHKSSQSFTPLTGQ